jgi:tRNA(fMet)-specific endonuclease VapC
MTIYTLDTNIVSQVLRQNPVVTHQFNSVATSANHFLGCPMVWFEARRGLLAKDAKLQTQRLDQMFSGFDWQDYDRDDWILAATLWAKRRASGIPIGDADLLIAVFTINRNAVLVTDNEKDFADLGVTVENWTKS